MINVEYIGCMSLHTPKVYVFVCVCMCISAYVYFTIVSISINNYQNYKIITNFVIWTFVFTYQKVIIEKGFMYFMFQITTQYQLSRYPHTFYTSVP